MTRACSSCGFEIHLVLQGLEEQKIPHGNNGCDILSVPVKRYALAAECDFVYDIGEIGSCFTVPAASTCPGAGLCATTRSSAGSTVPCRKVHVVREVARCANGGKRLADFQS